MTEVHWIECAWVYGSHSQSISPYSLTAAPIPELA
jgi:hypothetical protein